MNLIRLRVGVLATISGLVLMTAGVATAQAQGNTQEGQDHASQGDNRDCVSWDRGSVWQTHSPDGKGWHKGDSRLVPEVPEVEGQDFVAAVEGVPAIPQVDHTEYQYQRTVDGTVVTSEWLRAMPAGDGWVQSENHQVIDHAAVPEVVAVPEVPFIAAVEEVPAYTVYHWTRAAKECKGDKHRHHKGDKNCKHESHDSDHGHGHGSHETTPPVTTSPATPPASVTTAPAALAPIAVAPAKAAVPVVVSPAEAAVNPLPLAAAAGQADTSGQLAGGFAGFAAFLALGAGLVLRRRRSDV